METEKAMTAEKGAAKMCAEENRQDSGWYTLQGVRVKEPKQKGIYIQNGRLVVNP